MKTHTGGELMIIGGAEDKQGERVILKKVIEITGGSGARLVVLTTATEEPEAIGSEYMNIFSRLGVEKLEILDIHTREEAENENFCRSIEKADGVFFTGGDQLRITSILGGTRVYAAMHHAYRKGTVFIGTSAGASAMSNTMIVDGNDNGPARKCTLKMAPGLGLLNDAIIDQHFDQRGRIGRLLCGVAENPHMLGIGIDEDTAVHVLPDNRFEVLGSNAVTVIDGQSIRSSNVSELRPDEILAITGITLHILPAGYGFDMSGREVLRLH
ncbi:MAG TPA: cyanophycinase [Clostridiales bacterium]|nr:cyanophycinase [Clostridiales bacterium]